MMNGHAHARAGQRPPAPGRCRVCGCTETNACVAIRAPGGDVRNCAWADDRQTLCDNPDCLADAACEGGERAIG
jgi:hypothetical protein